MIRASSAYYVDDGPSRCGRCLYLKDAAKFDTAEEAEEYIKGIRWPYGGFTVEEVEGEQQVGVSSKKQKVTKKEEPKTNQTSFGF